VLGERRSEARGGEDKELLRLIGAQRASIVRTFALDSILWRVGVTCLGLLSFLLPVMNTHVYSSSASSVPALLMKRFNFIQFRIICIYYCHLSL
jgi:hypothetical protein